MGYAINCRTREQGFVQPLVTLCWRYELDADTTEQSLVDAGLSRQSLFQNLQVTPHPVFGYRPQMGVYEVTSDINVPSGIVKANPDLGVGGATQYFIRNYSNQLRLVDTINLGP